MASASLILKTKVQFDFGKDVFHLNVSKELIYSYILCFILHLSKALFLTLLSLKKKKWARQLLYVVYITNLVCQC